MRDERAHQAFREAELAESERVTWMFPMLDKIEHRNVHLRDIVQLLEHDKHHPVSIEVGRLVGLYRADLLKALEAHERRYNRGSMPQVSIAREHEPRWPIEHAAMHCFACAVDEIFTDVTEEVDLLHPDAR
jgi:hypothetical protein